MAGFFDKMRKEMLQRRGIFQTNDNEDLIEDRVDKGKKVTVNNPTSFRSYFTGNDGHFISGDYTIGKDSNADKTVGLASTAIKQVEYNPDTKQCFVTYQGGGDKKYEFEMTPEEFKKFMNSDSKGRYCAKIMKIYNRAPGY